MNIGSRIRSARENAGLTMEELGKKCGTTKQTIYKYETGKVTNIPLDRLQLIASVVGVSAAYLLGWEEAEADLHRAGLSWDTVAEEMGLPSWSIDRILQNPDHPEDAERITRTANLLASELGSEGSGITPREYKLVTLYRTASDKDRIVVDTVLGMEPEN